MSDAAPATAPVFTPLDQLAVNTIRTLAMDAVQKANSGHPGAPMGLAPVAYALWQRHLRYDPADAQWPNRDRFVLSNGHASMLIYGLLHLAGVQDGNGKRKPVTLDEIKHFRQLESVTPGHPENFLTAGVETTTGPLGQGCGNSVGMAIASKWIQARYSRPGFEDLFGYRTYAICGDGCMMEGVTSESASLAAHLKLDNLCWIYDDNSITIDGRTSLAFTEDVATRFMGYGWNVIRVSDANDMVHMSKALDTFEITKKRPTLIIVKTLIAYGAPNKQDTKEAHGEPLGDAEIKLTKQFYGWPEDKSFYVPDGIYDLFKAGIGKRGADLHKAWNAKFAAYKTQYPTEAAQLEHLFAGTLPAGWDKEIPAFPADAKGLATRDSSGKVLNAIAKNFPWIVGGSADLNPSTKTKLTFDGAGVFQADSPGGRNIHFGVREHGMGAILNGMVLSGIRSYGSGFLIFRDYGVTPIRLAAIMEIPVLYVFTHDSIGVGEDGPTHQPIEQLAALRATPSLCLIRPADANEVAEAYRVAMQLTHEPTILAMTRQALPTLDRTKYASAAGVAKGGYILADAAGGKPQVILIGTGSEVSLCVEVYEKLTAEGIAARVVSLPSWDLYEKQPKEYRDSVLPPSITARVTVEMASTLGWDRYAGPSGTIIGMRSYGASAPLKDLAKHFGFTADAVYQAAKKQLG